MNTDRLTFLASLTTGSPVHFVRNVGDEFETAEDAAVISITKTTIRIVFAAGGRADLDKNGYVRRFDSRRIEPSTMPAADRNAAHRARLDSYRQKIGEQRYESCLGKFADSITPPVHGPSNEGW